MAQTQPKALVPLLMLRILEKFSDEKHPLTREDMERILNEDYGITMERKAFFRHIEHLQGLEDVDLRRVTVKPKEADKNACAGFYLADRLFSELELRVIIDALSGSRYLSRWETEDLVQRLSVLSTQRFQKKMAAYQFVGLGNKTENETLLLNLELIDEAMAQHKQITFALLHTDGDGKKVVSDWQNESCSPLRYFVKEHHYYLVGIHNTDGTLNLVSYRLSDMVNVEVLDTPAEDIRDLAECKHGIDWQKFLREHPALENLRGKPERCTFLCYRWMVDEVKSHFGDELRMRRLSEEEEKRVASVLVGAVKGWLVEVSIIADPYAAIQFAWYHPEGLWLIAPKRAASTLRNRLKTQKQHYAELEKIYE